MRAAPAGCAACTLPIDLAPYPEKDFPKCRPSSHKSPVCETGCSGTAPGASRAPGRGAGRRQVLAVELANRESRSSWRDFLLGLKARGLHGVEFVVADDHAGLRAALREVLAEAAYQRCYVHFLRNALDYVPRKVDDDCLQELRWLGACPRAGEAGPGGPARS